MIPDCTEMLTKLYRERLQDQPSPSPQRRPGATLVDATNGSGPSDAQVVEKLLGERTDKGRRLHTGDTSEYESGSEADLAYLDKLAFYTQDPDQLDRIWRASGLNRKKLDRADYRRRTIEVALNKVEEVYDWTRLTVLLIEGTAKSKAGDEGGAESRQALSNLFQRADLSAPLKEGVKPPEVLIPEVLLAGKVHSIYSAGGTGKTFVMLHLVKRVTERGKRVMIFDLENGLRIMAERLELLGVTPEEAELIHYYPFPIMPLDGDVVSTFEELLDETDPALVVFDSWVNCLAACGLDENSSTDIAAWADAYSQKVRMRGTTVLILDHVPKEGGSARGSGRKLDYVDVQHELVRTRDFSRTAVRHITLRLKKDREGWLPQVVPFTVGGGRDGFVFCRALDEIPGGDNPTLNKNENILLEALREFGSMGAFDKEWKEGAKELGVKAGSSYYKAKAKLLERGDLVEQVMDKYFAKVLQK